MKLYRALLPQAITLLLFCLFSNLIPLQAQMRVGQPAGTPDPSAALDVSGGPYANGSPYRGIAPPKVALTQTASATPVNSPITGLLVYNTANVGDVTPGYYYWEGSRWVRFATASPGSARVAAAGDPIPAYTLSELHGLTTTPAYVILIEPGKEGLFYYDSMDTSSLDDNGMILVTTAPANIGKRYKRIIEGYVNVKWFGAKGDNITDDSQAFIHAINYLANAVTFPNGKLSRKLTGNPGTLLIPVGTYLIQDVPINGSIKVKGQGGGTYALSYIHVQWNHNGFILGPDTGDHSSNSTSFEDLGFFSAQPDSTARADGAVAHVITQLNTGSPPLSLNSIYYRNCWFQTCENTAIWHKQGGDIQITGCTFDENFFDAVRLANVQDARITNNLFYNVRVNHIRAEGTVDGLVVANNQAFMNGLYTPQATFLNTATATRLTGVVVNANTTRGVSRFINLETSADKVVVSNNIQLSVPANTDVNLPNFFIHLTGGQIATNVKITSNITSALSTYLMSPVSGVSCGLQNSQITGNTFINAVASSTQAAINLPDSRANTNIIRDNSFQGFSVNPISVVDKASNGIYDLATMVQGANPASRATASSNANEDRPSGFYTTFDNTNLPNTGGYLSLGMRSRFATETPGLTWAHDLEVNAKTARMYSRTYDAQANAWLDFKLVHDNRWFNVNESLTNTAQTALWNNGTNWTSAPYKNPSPTVVGSASQQMVKNTKYQANYSSQVVFTLPSNAAWEIGDQVEVIGLSANGWKIVQNTGETIHTGISAHPDTTTGTSGGIAASGPYDTVTIEKVSQNHYIIKQYTSASGLTIF